MHCMRANDESLGNLGVGQALCDQAQDLDLASGQAGRVGDADDGGCKDGGGGRDGTLSVSESSAPSTPARLRNSLCVNLWRTHSSSRTSS